MELVADRYSVGSPIGSGRSTVYRGQDTVLQRPVALKEVKLSAGQEDQDRVRARARREAQAAARLNNPSVVDVFDIVEEVGSLWLVMELVDAPNLAQVVQDEGPLSHQRAAEIGLDVLSALAAAHAVGVVHRDVKPANVLVRPEAPAKLADFGVATIRGESRVTSTGLVVGSPAYMAPEQAMGETAGPAADLWALGATLYFAVEGVPPFGGNSAIATANAVVHDEPRPQEHPGPLSRIIGQLLQKDPQARPTVGEVHTALLAASRTKPSAATVANAAPAAATVAEPTREASPTKTMPADEPVRTDEPRRSDSGPSSQRSLVNAAIAAVLLLVLGAIGWALLRGGDDDEDPGSDQAGRRENAAAETTEAEPEESEGSEESDPTTTAAPSTTATTTASSTTAPPPAGGGAAVPPGWTAYQHPGGAYTIAHPPGWQVVQADGPRIDIRDPVTRTTLRIDWTDSPKSDPVADWRDQSRTFASRHPGYQEIGIAPYTYRDYNAALWEFTYPDGGTTLHVANLGFVAGNRGYALLFRTTDTRWEASQDLYAQFRQAFQPIPRPT